MTVALPKAAALDRIYGTIDSVDCWHCRRTAVGTCRFCGRAVCENHAKTQPYILELFERKGARQALVVEDALYCGACTPRPAPVSLPELD